VTTRISMLAAFALSASTGPALAAANIQVAQSQAPQQQPAQAPRQMTRADFTKTLDARFAEMDTNKDGVLSREEIVAAQTRSLQQAAAVQQQRLEAEFKRLDTNNDGQLSIEEFKAAAPPVRPAQTVEQMLAQLDTNKDGRISAQEFRAAPLANFDRLDTNNDGVVSAQELQAARPR
jgi:Ca2+-binding EF-hand superfamily protein